MAKPNPWNDAVRMGDFSRGQLAQFIPFLQNLAAPQLNMAALAGLTQGQRLGQNVQSSISAIGGGSSGIGAVSRGLASSAGSSFAIQARLGLMNQLFSGAIGLTGDLQNQLGQRVLLGQGNPQSFMSKFGNALMGGGAAAGQFFSGGGGGQGGGSGGSAPPIPPWGIA